MLRSISGWQADASVEPRSYSFRYVSADALAAEEKSHRRVSIAYGQIPSQPPSARIVDVQVATKGAAVMPATKQAVLFGERPAKGVALNGPFIAPNLHGVRQVAGDGPLQAWLRAQQETSETSTKENCAGQLDIYA